MGVQAAPTADVLRAIRLLLSSPDTSGDSENDTHHRQNAPSEDGWHMPRDLTRSRRSTVRHVGTCPKACSDTDTSRLRQRLLEWELIETTRGQRADNKSRKLKKPPVFIRLRRDPEGVQRITSLLMTAQSLHSLKPIPGLTRLDLDPENPENLAVFREWIQAPKFQGAQAEAAAEALYVDYRYHQLRAELVTAPGFPTRLQRTIPL